MKVIESDVKYLEEDVNRSGIYEHIEKCGKICYKSTPKGDDTAIDFVNRMIKNEHYAMLEHGTVYLKCEQVGVDPLDSPLAKYKTNKYSKVYMYNFPASCTTAVYVTTNLRVIVENGWENDLVYLCGPTCFHEKRFTFKITCDRAVSHELVRHRVFSFAQESQRYCNYSKDKFDNQITFIKPAIADNNHEFLQTWENAMTAAESTYNQLLADGYKPQDARSVLPNSTKTEIIMTGFQSDWHHFLHLRYYQETGPVHPDMLKISTKIYNKITELVGVGWDKMEEMQEKLNNKENKQQKTSEEQRHKEILEKLHRTYLAKNTDYGDSFAKLSNEYGPVYALAHMEEKLERVKTLFKTNKNNVGEKISDTLLDLANYAILTAMQFTEIDK